MHYHIVGIAGAGMSAIAQILLDQGHTVSGSDLQRNALTRMLEQRGAVVRSGHAPEHIAGADALVVTSAVKPDHVELAAARASNIPVLKRADLWAEWSRIRPTIAVAGTHGKTTTTAMIALALTQAGLNPGFLVGGEVPDLGTNARWGDPAAPLVIEADEYDRAFLALTPQVAVITNVELDHVDIYPTQESYEAAFRQFAQSVPLARNVIQCGDDPGALRSFEHPDGTQYGIDERIATDPASCRLAPLDWTAANVRNEDGRTSFDLWLYDRGSYATRLAGTQSLRLPGEHNVRNALAALAACAAIGAPMAGARAALEAYRGALRRFEHKGEAGGVTVIDDYAHHPTEVRATLAAARARYTGRRILAYVQPHTYSRTRALFSEWPAAFVDADCVFVGDIYAAREQDTLGVSAAGLADAIGVKAQAVGSIVRAAQQILEQIEPGDLLLTLGAGDSSRVGELVLEGLHQ
jgi:UDP-N-acetylmuramate--alanine ligase